MAEVKPGKHTTEFWLTVIAGGILGLAVIGAVVLAIVRGTPISDTLGSFSVVVGPCIAILTGAYAVSRAITKRNGNGGGSTGLFLLIGASLLLGPAAGCGHVGKALVGIQKSAEKSRKVATALLDAKCATVAKACPAGKASDCNALVTCQKDRAAIYDQFRKVQLGVIWGLTQLAAEKKLKAESYLNAIKGMLSSLEVKLTAARVLPEVK